MITNKTTMRRTMFVSVLFAWVLLMTNALPVQAQDLTDAEAIEAAEQVADTLAAAEGLVGEVDPAPDWYVAPVIPEARRAPKRAKAAVFCPVDSVCTFDENGNIVGVTEYDYDNTGRVINVTVWTYTNGQRVGVSKNDYGFDANGTQVMTATYEWVPSINNWRGLDKTEYAYDNEDRIIANTVYAWVNNAWVPQTKYTYEFDSEGREKEYTMYVRNALTNQLDYSKRRTQEWDEEGRQVLDIQYTAYDGTDWSAGTKKVWAFDANGNQTEYTYYSSITNHSWVGSVRELWTYDGTTKIKYEKYVWGSGNWVGSSKEEWGYTDGMLMMNATYKWSNGAWEGVSKKEWKYTGSNKTLYAEYTWQNGAWVGVSKEEWTYVSGKLTLHAEYTWQSGAWAGVNKEEWAYESGRDKQYKKSTWTNGAWLVVEQKDWTYNAAGKKTLYEYKKLENGSLVVYEQEKCTYEGSNQTSSEKYERKNGVWTGVTKETWVYTSGKKTKYNTFTWSNGVWADATEEVWAYSGSNITNYEKYAWESGAKVGKEKYTSAYTSGKKTEHVAFAWENDTWVRTDKEVWGYTSGKVTLHELYVWDTSDWTITLQEKSAFDAAGNTTLVEICKLVDGVWTGEIKEEYTFNAAKQKIVIIISAWTGSKWVNSTKTEADYLGDLQILDAKYVWQDEAWVGDGTRVETVYTDGKISLLRTYVWNASAKDWTAWARRELVYDDVDRLIGDTTRRYVDGAWEYYAIQTHSYDNKGHDTLAVTGVWNGTQWDTTYIHIETYRYTASGKTLLIESYEGQPGALSGLLKAEYTYDAAEHQIKYMQYEWKNGAWSAKNKSEQTYDAAGNQTLSESYKWDKNSKKKYAWIGVSKNEYAYDYTYNPAGRQTMQARYTWDSKKDKWKGASRTDKEYDAAGNITASISYSWSAGSSVWVKSTRESYVFDNKSRVVEVVIGVWMGSDWGNNMREAYVYDSKGQTISTHKYWWINDDWSIYYLEDKEYDVSDNKLRRETDGSWNDGVLESYSDKHYFYRCDTHFFTIRFTNDDGTVLQSEDIEEGTAPTYNGATPTKSADAQYTYTFKGWDKAIVPVSGAATYTATYTKTVNKYVITFANEDGTTIEAKEWEYGAIPVPPAAPTKPATEEYTYTFAGWGKEIVAVTGATTYTATFTTGIVTYTVTFKNGDEVLQSTQVEYGATPSYTGATPTKQADAQYTYMFKGWDKEIVAVTAHVTYSATFISTVNTYTITFKNGETVLQSSEVAYGTKPTYTGAMPTKAADAQYTYTFDGWDSEVVSVTGAATYNATFSSTVNTYTITFKNGDKVLQSTEVAYGTTPQYTGATPTQAATAQYTYTFKGWDKAIVAVTGAATYTAQFSASLNSYLITFLNYDGKVLDSHNWDYGCLPNITIDPTRPADAQYTYTFAGWDKDVEMVTKAATYTAVYTKTLNKYTITWLNDDNSLIDKTEVEYGVIPTHADATKENTAEWTYTFAGWDQTPVAVTGDATYKATFSQTKNAYTITWLNDDNSLIDKTTVEYGVVPSHADATKENTAEWTYTFAGWDQTPVAVTGDAIYKATFSQTKNAYTITWLNDDNSLIDKTTVEYGVVPTHVDATKENTAEWTYTFAGWDQTPVAVTGDATYKATFSQTKNAYTITWLNDDNSLIEKTTVEYGVVPTHADATKENTAEWTYTFAGWDQTPVAVTGDATYKATFSQTKNAYTITWLNDDNSLIDKTTVEYGVVPSHADATKENTAEWTYTFAGWDQTPVAVTGDATYKATFSQTKNAYTITWLNDDNSLIEKTTVEYGVVPSHADATKANTAEWTYTFAGWDQTPVAVTGDATYKATFNQTKNSYTITWLNDDNSLIDKTTVEYGVVPTHADATKENTAEWTYTFTGWDATPVAVTGDATYKATFSSTKNSYTITWLNDDNSLIDKTTVEYGVVPTHADATKENTAEWTYTFAGWDQTPVAVTGDATYKAMFNQTKNAYTITWLNDDNSLIDKTTVEYGVVPSHADATKANTAEWTYTFAGWDQTPVAVTGDATYIATFSQTKNSYTITWLNDDNTLIDQTTVEYGVVPSYADPTKEATAQFTYTFVGWTPEVVAVTGEASYKATFTETVNKYTVTFFDEDGETVLEANEWEYGATPTCEDPTKEATAQFTYTFAGWTPEIEVVTGEATYTATYTSTLNTYDVTFEVKDHPEMSYTIPGVPYGTPLSVLIEQLKTMLGGETLEDETHIYTFAGLEDTELTDIVTSDATYYILYTLTEKPGAAVDNTRVSVPVQKIIRNDHVYIIREGKTYSVEGIEVR